jgi:DNA-binding Xre family transcriptional regulator
MHQNWCVNTEIGLNTRFLFYSATYDASRAAVIRYKLKELIAQKSFDEGRRVTLDEVSAETGISRNTLSRIANTRGYSTTIDAIDRLCEYFDCQINELIERVNVSDRPVDN